MIRRKKIMRLRFEDWMTRKGLTCQKIVESGINTEVELLAMADRLGVLPPVDLQGFTDIWEADNNPAESETKPTKASVSSNVTKEKASTAGQTKTGARTVRRKSTRKKTNIKDDDK